MYKHSLCSRYDIAVIWASPVCMYVHAKCAEYRRSIIQIVSSVNQYNLHRRKLIVALFWSLHYSILWVIQNCRLDLPVPGPVHGCSTATRPVVWDCLVWITSIGLYTQKKRILRPTHWMVATYVTYSEPVATIWATWSKRIVTFLGCSNFSLNSTVYVNDFQWGHNVPIAYVLCLYKS
jgi:hypothetical protein